MSQRDVHPRAELSSEPVALRDDNDPSLLLDRT